MLNIDPPATAPGADDSADFTVDRYRELLVLAKKNYNFIRYPLVPHETSFVLWRHDCDFSLNRAYRLARIEKEEGVVSTYFVNPHCEFYNLLEKSQALIVKNILDIGHDVGLHFDSAFYDVSTEEQLEDAVANETRMLTLMLGVTPSVFSFHNPTAFVLTCEKESYGGLINCYSRRFKKEVAYCSDSNGYWRFRRLREILQAAAEPRLQVLTHPGWWQETPLQPRQRVFRCVYGRAESTMRYYDSAVEQFGRTNLAGPAEALFFLKGLDPAAYYFCDYLWNKGQISTLFYQLWRLHELQIKHLCQAMIHKDWHISAHDTEEFFSALAVDIDSLVLFQSAFGVPWSVASGHLEEVYRDFEALHCRLLRQRSHVSLESVEKACINLCGIVDRIARWGRDQEKISLDGFGESVKPDPREQTGNHLSMSQSNSQKWNTFRSLLNSISTRRKSSI